MRPFHLQSLKLFSQIVFTCTIVALPVSSVVKAFLLLVLWVITFSPFSRAEFAIFLFVNLLYSVGNIMSVQKGVFAFSSPDFLGLPAYEFGMWGFYFLHTIRTLAPKHDPILEKKSVPLAILFSASFSASSNPNIVPILAVSSLLLLIYFYHSHDDIRFAIYFTLFGSILEVLGVMRNEWSYPQPFQSSVAPWFFCLFAGSGILCYRIAIPLIGFLTRKWA